ncbi:sugar ABC transporter ATP-binding protein [Agathobaculum sp. NTUH-O15-33]|uniref:sugar ABC transporter ATP-binding protein n=1 Tax=Agathobaculum sp. NTUH-O15-33 TaxID=3079302 RepID=UPI002958CCE2|nr:sugar ABC transporter ATP-binding protein [Agathobaculum sp. NTUH-O15-33]WNX84940.1 sugar ABC transporter ATP-binding protein [Agathobaculum sp. NTUH-O15-33]
MGDHSCILKLENIKKSFSGVPVLEGVNIELHTGTVHALVGENGAGKSTLMKIISGLYAPDAGRIWYKGAEISDLTPQKSLELGISMIHQELNPEPYMTIAENIFLGREPCIGPGGKFVHFKKMYQDTQNILTKMDIAYDPHTTMGELSLAGKQLIEIAKAISRNASVVIMDEPTSALTDDEVAILFRQIEDLKAKNVAVIYITHKMDEIFALADDITVLRDGVMIESAPRESFTMESLINQMVGREIKDVFPKFEVPIGETVFEVRGLTSKGVFENISFSLRKGEILGLSGLVGAGRTEVSRAIFGLDKFDTGEIFMNGKPLVIRNTRNAIAAGIAYVPEDRKEIGLVLCRPIRENVSLAALEQIESGGFLNLEKEKSRVRQMVERLLIKISSAENVVSSLSGGNQQKVVLAKWLMRDLQLLILDEPTRGIDVGAKAEIHRMMCELAGKGLAILMISSELPEILGMSDRVLIMHEGKITGELSRSEATQEKIMKYAVMNEGYRE